MEMATFLVLIGITWYHTAMAMANEPPISHRDPVSELRRTLFCLPFSVGRKGWERFNLHPLSLAASLDIQR
jgi:hypothetical protein